MSQAGQKKKTILRVKRRLCDTEIPVLVISERQKKRQRTIPTSELIDSFSSLNTAPSAPAPDDSKNADNDKNDLPSAPSNLSNTLNSSNTSTAPFGVASKHINFFDFDFEPQFYKKQSVFRLISNKRVTHKLRERHFQSNANFVEQRVKRRALQRRLERKQTRQNRLLQQQESQKKRKESKHSKQSKHGKNGKNSKNKSSKSSLTTGAAGIASNDGNDGSDAEGPTLLATRGKGDLRSSLCKDKGDKSRAEALEKLKQRLKNRKQNQKRAQTKIVTPAERDAYKRKIAQQNKFAVSRLQSFKKQEDEAMDAKDALAGIDRDISKILDKNGVKDENDTNDTNDTNGVTKEKSAFPADWNFNAVSLTQPKGDKKGLQPGQDASKMGAKPANAAIAVNAANAQKNGKSAKKVAKEPGQDGTDAMQQEESDFSSAHSDSELEEDIDIVDLEYDPVAKTYKRVLPVPLGKTAIDSKSSQNAQNTQQTHNNASNNEKNDKNSKQSHENGRDAAGMEVDEKDKDVVWDYYECDGNVFASDAVRKDDGDENMVLGRDEVKQKKVLEEQIKRAYEVAMQEKHKSDPFNNAFKSRAELGPMSNAADASAVWAGAAGSRKALEEQVRYVDFDYDALAPHPVGLDWNDLGGMERNDATQQMQDALHDLEPLEPQDPQQEGLERERERRLRRILDDDNYDPESEEPDYPDAPRYASEAMDAVENVENVYNVDKEFEKFWYSENSDDNGNGAACDGNEEGVVGEMDGNGEDLDMCGDCMQSGGSFAKKFGREWNNWKDETGWKRNNKSSGNSRNNRNEKSKQKRPERNNLLSFDDFKSFGNI